MQLLFIKGEITACFYFHDCSVSFLFSLVFIFSNLIKSENIFCNIILSIVLNQTKINEI